MFGIEVAIDDGKALPLKSGLVAKLTIVPASAVSGSRVYVPIGAIVEGDGRNARLFVLDKDRARRRDIEVAFIEGAIVALAGGVDVGEQVITDGAQYLEDGERVATLKSVAAARGRELPGVSDPALPVHARRVRDAGRARHHFVPQHPAPGGSALPRRARS